jgi:competence protein ComEC
MPLFYLCVAFLLGIATGPYSPFAANPLFVAAGVSVVAGGAASQLTLGSSWIRAHESLLARLALSPAALPVPALRFLPFLMMAAGFMGAGRYAASRPDFSDPAFIGHHNDSGERVTLTGILVEPPDTRDTYTNLRIEVEALRPANGVLHSTVHGRVLARVSQDTDYAYGDRLVITGKLSTPPEAEDFSYRSYLAGQGVYSYLPFAEAAVLEPAQGQPIWRAVFALQRRAHTMIYTLFPDPEAALLAGILLGIETGITPDLKAAFRDTGTAHIVAISGFNITILGAIFTALFSRVLGERAGALLAIVVIGLYTILVGADAAVVRAALMGGMVIIARRLRRGQAAINTLAFVAALMAYANPLVLNDPGFQLSFAATLGLVLYAEPLTEAFRRRALVYLRISVVDRITPPISEFVLLTIAAQLATLPIVIAHFERLSLSSFLVNPLVLPVQSAIMILGGLAVAAGLIWLPMGSLIGAPVWALTAYTIRVVELFGRFREGVLVLGPVNAWGVALMFAVLILGTTSAQIRPPLERSGRFMLAGLRRAVNPITLILVVALAILVWRQVLSQPDGILHVTLLDANGGEAVFIETPGGQCLLINGGVSTVQLSDALGRRMPLGSGGLDALIVASTQDIHIQALPRVVERFVPEQVLWSGLPAASRAGSWLEETLVELKVPVSQAERGHRLELGDGVWLDVLAAGPRGAALLLTYGHFRMLMPIGATLEDLESWRMGADLGPISALLLADSGHRASSPAAFLQALHPELVLLSVASGDRDGLPHAEVLDILAGYPLLRTDQDGWIQLSTDGDQLWVEVENPDATATDPDS